jgi:hypothetical protein
MADRPEPTPADIERAARVARFFRAQGYNALPSRMNIKGPALASYADYWEKPLPDSVYDEWATTNIQVMTGARWKLCVVDCDGEEAIDVWRQMLHHYGTVAETWTARTGSGGLHFYFAVPAWLDECPSRRLWGVWDTWAGTKHEGDWSKHKEVRLLADKALVIAPPSVHVTTGQRYHFLPTCGPKDFPRPMEAPDWLLNMPAIQKPQMFDEPPAMKLARDPVKTPTRPAGEFWDRDEVLAAIRDKIGLARSWGLRLAVQKGNPKGWWSCHAIDREDATPSASIHEESGVYAELRDGRKLPFFDLAVALKAYPDWETAKNDLGARFCPRVRAREGKIPA